MKQGPNNLSQPTANHGRSTIVRVFIGDQGLRSGWRLFLYIIAVVLLESLFLTVLRRLLGHSPQVETPGRSIIGEGLLLIAATIPALVAARLEHRPWGTYGLPSRKGEAQKLVTGLVVGFIALSTLLFLIHLFHSFYLGPIALPGAQLVRFAVAWAIAFLLVGVTEEFLFRGYSLYTLASGNRLLASRSFAFCILRRHPSTKYWRRLDRRLGYDRHRIGFCFQPVAHRQPLVRGRLTRIVGLGRELFLRSSRQWLQSSWDAVHSAICRIEMDHRRQRWSGRQRSRLRHCHRNGIDDPPSLSQAAVAEGLVLRASDQHACGEHQHSA